LVLTGAAFHDLRVVDQKTGEEVENVLEVRFEEPGMEGDPPELWIRLLDMREDRSFT
jgi:hypothetical protein